MDVTRPEAEPIPQSIPGADDKQPQLKHPEDESYAEVVGTKPKTRKRRNAFIFSLGGLFGIVLAGFFASTNDLIEFPEFSDLSFESVLQMLPEGMINDYRDLLVRTTLPRRVRFWRSVGRHRIANRSALLSSRRKANGRSKRAMRPSRLASRRSPRVSRRTTP